MGVWSEVKMSQVDAKSRFDSEYYLPEYINTELILDRIFTKKLPELFWVSDGNHLEVSKYFSNDNRCIPYYRGKDITDFFIENATPVRIPEHIFNSGMMRRSHFKACDVLLSIVGTIGSLSIVPEDFGNATGSCKLAILRKKNFCSPYYLAAFLLCKHGQAQVKRNTRGAVQMGLILKDFIKIRIPIFSPKVEKKIEELIKNSIIKNKLSKTYFIQAQKLLEKALGFDKLVLQKSKSYESTFNEVVTKGRVDADYYQTHFRIHEEHIRSIPTKPLGQIVNYSKGIEVGSSNYSNSGKLFIRVSNIKENQVVTGNSDKYVSNSLYNTLHTFKPNVGDILLTKDGTLGVCYVVDREIEGIISGGIMKLQIKDLEIPAEYLGLVINSKVCKLQIERVCSGALILHWKPQDIANLNIPILNKATMNELSELVIKSKQAKKESEQLLEQAKRQVEDLIEGRDEQ